MSFLKKITSFWFDDEDPDVVVEDELEDISVREKPQEEVETEEEQPQNVQPNVTQGATVEPNEIPDEEPVEETVKTVKEQPVSEVVETKKSIRIDLYDDFSNTYNKVREKRREDKQDYEPEPILSPIFGANDVNDSSDKQKSMVTTLTRKQKKNPLGTILSPYYGLSEAKQVEEEVKPEQNSMNEKVEEVQKPVMDVIPEVICVPKPTEFEKVTTPCDTKQSEPTGVTLEEMLAKDEAPKPKQDAPKQDLLSSLLLQPAPVVNNKDDKSNENE